MDRENLAIARERLEELGPDATGETGKATEIEAALLDDLGGPAYVLEGRREKSRITALVLLLLIPLASAGIYAWLGDTRWTQTVAQSPSGNVGGHTGGMDISRLLERLEQSLEENPENADGWAIAGRTYMVMNNFAKAENAYAKVHQLVGDDPDILTAWADASLMRNGGLYTPEIAGRVDRALELDPVQVNALWIGAMGSRGIGDLGKSDRYVERLRPLLADNPEALSQLESTLGGTAPPADSTAAEQSGDAMNGAAIEVLVSADSSLTAGVDPETPVFVYARALEGPPMPLAAQRLRLGDLPATVVLDDRSGMIQGRTLSSAERVLVAARVALGGTPTAQTGDLTSEPLESPTRGNTGIELRIDTVVP
jgi:cytochrome c-type biogenesis protein CcmH